MLRLFLSYASQDADRVRRFAADLRRPGIDPWMDDALKLAGEWNTEIGGRIAACDLFLPLMSVSTQNGDATRFFRREWQLAYEARRRFLPVRLEECGLPPALPVDLATAIENHQREDLFPSYDAALRRILRFLHEEKRTGVFEESFSCLGPDNEGWRLNRWALDEADSTGGNSRSLHATASLDNSKLLPQTVRRTAAIDVDLPGGALMLRYRRRLNLSAPLLCTAGFEVLVDGEAVDRANQGDPAEATWITRSVPVSERSARRAAIEFIVTASSGMNYFPVGEAWIDDIRIS